MTDHITSVTYFEARRAIERYCRERHIDVKDFCEAHFGNRAWCATAAQRPERCIKQSTFDKIHRVLGAS